MGGVIWASTVLAPEPIIYQTFAIDLFSPPPSVEAAEMQPGSPDELVIDAPPEAPRETPPPKPEPAAEAPAPPRPEPPRPTQSQRAATTPPRDSDSTRTGQPSAGPGAVAGSPGGENINIRMEGLRRDFPEYYEGIVLQITRCFSRARKSGRDVAVVSFSILRDGSITDIRLARRSPNAAFNVEAMGAVECAGSAPPGAPSGSPSRIGAMPADMPYDRLPVQFTFSPAGPGPDL
jgi:protein TonB